MIKTLTIPFVSDKVETASETEQDNFLALVQDFTDAHGNNPTGNDLIAMYNYIVAGMSAHQYSRGDCPVTFEDDGITLTLPFFVNIYPMDLQYTLSATHGDISAQSIHIGEEQRQILVGMSDEVDLEVFLTDVIVEWETSCYDEDGSIITRPSHEVSGTRLIFPEKVFQVGWGHVYFECHKYTIDIKCYYDEDAVYTDFWGRRITAAQAVESGQVTYIQADFSSTITAQYQNLNGKIITKTLELEIPECIENILGVCFKQDPDKNPDNTKDNDGKGTVWYNFCDGVTIKVDDPDIGYEPEE